MIVEGPAIEKVILVTRIARPKGFVFEVDSYPGHHLTLIQKGQLHVECGGQIYKFRPGTVIWYHEMEKIRGKVLESPCVYYSINFVAPALSPPSLECRFMHLPGRKIFDYCEKLYEAWMDTSAPTLIRGFQVEACLFQILAQLTFPMQQIAHFSQETKLWWQLEAELRKDLSRHISSQFLSELAKRSGATVARSCQSAVGVTPLRRVKQLRLSMARGLIRMSTLTISEIAERTGYDRVHELSRDYHKFYGITPTRDRKDYPKIYQKKFGFPFAFGK